MSASETEIQFHLPQHFTQYLSTYLQQKTQKAALGIGGIEERFICWNETFRVGQSQRPIDQQNPSLVALLKSLANMETSQAVAYLNKYLFRASGKFVLGSEEQIQIAKADPVTRSRGFSHSDYLEDSSITLICHVANLIKHVNQLKDLLDCYAETQRHAATQWPELALPSIDIDESDDLTPVDQAALYGERLESKERTLRDLRKPIASASNWLALTQACKEVDTKALCRIKTDKLASKQAEIKAIRDKIEAIHGLMQSMLASLAGADKSSIPLQLNLREAIHDITRLSEYWTQKEAALEYDNHTACYQELKSLWCRQVDKELRSVQKQRRSIQHINTVRAQLDKIEGELTDDITPKLEHAETEDVFDANDRALDEYIRVLEGEIDTALAPLNLSALSDRSITCLPHAFWSGNAVYRALEAKRSQLLELAKHTKQALSSRRVQVKIKGITQRASLYAREIQETFGDITEANREAVLAILKQHHDALSGCQKELLGLQDEYCLDRRAIAHSRMNTLTWLAELIESLKTEDAMMAQQQKHRQLMGHKIKIQYSLEAASLFIDSSMPAFLEIPKDNRALQLTLLKPYIRNLEACDFEPLIEARLDLGDLPQRHQQVLATAQALATHLESEEAMADHKAFLLTNEITSIEQTLDGAESFIKQYENDGILCLSKEERESVLECLDSHTQSLQACDFDPLEKAQYKDLGKLQSRHQSIGEREEKLRDHLQSPEALLNQKLNIILETINLKMCLLDNNQVDEEGLTGIETKLTQFEAKLSEIKREIDDLGDTNAQKQELLDNHQRIIRSAAVLSIKLQNKKSPYQYHVQDFLGNFQDENLQEKRCIRQTKEDILAFIQNYSSEATGEDVALDVSIDRLFELLITLESAYFKGILQQNDGNPLSFFHGERGGAWKDAISIIKQALREKMNQSTYKDRTELGADGRSRTNASDSTQTTRFGCFLKSMYVLSTRTGHFLAGSNQQELDALREKFGIVQRSNKCEISTLRRLHEGTLSSLPKEALASTCKDNRQYIDADTYFKHFKENYTRLKAATEESSTTFEVRSRLTLAPASR